MVKTNKDKTKLGWKDIKTYPDRIKTVGMPFYMANTHKEMVGTRYAAIFFSSQPFLCGQYDFCMVHNHFFVVQNEFSVVLCDFWMVQSDFQMIRNKFTIE
jgi:hypothetical protein